MPLTHSTRNPTINCFRESKEGITFWEIIFGLFLRNTLEAMNIEIKCIKFTNLKLSIFDNTMIIKCDRPLSKNDGIQWAQPYSLMFSSFKKHKIVFFNFISIFLFK